MANRRFTSQFSYSWERMPVRLMGSFEQTDLGAKATRVINGITYTAQEMGSAGNSITIALVAGGTAGAEVVTVTGSAISVQIESGVSTRTQVVTAIEASAEAVALIFLSAASGGTAATLSAALPLQNGDDTDFTASSNCMTLSQVDTGVYVLSLPDSYQALIGCSIMVQADSDGAFGQILEADVTDDQEIRFIVSEAGSPINLANGEVLYISLDLRNSSSIGLN